MSEAETEEQRVITYDEVDSEAKMRRLVIIPKLEEHPDTGETSLEELYRLREGQKVIGVFTLADILPGVPENSEVTSRALAFIRVTLGKKLGGSGDYKNLRNPFAKDLHKMVDPKRMVFLFTPTEQK